MRAPTRKSVSVSAIAFGSLTLSCSLIAGPAFAAPDDTGVAKTATAVWNRLEASSDPKAAYEALSTGDRAAFDAYLVPAASEESMTLQPMDSEARAAVASGSVKLKYSSSEQALSDLASTQGCWAGNARYTEKAALGNSLWDTYTEGTWCGSGSSVTSASFSRSWSTIAAVGWRDGGQIGRGAGVSNKQARIWSQRKMILGTGGWDVQTRTPCLRLNGTASGRTSITLTCSTI